jgi:hypothetical protein
MELGGGVGAGVECGEDGEPVCRAIRLRRLKTVESFFSEELADDIAPLSEDRTEAKEEEEEEVDDACDIEGAYILPPSSTLSFKLCFVSSLEPLTFMANLIPLSTSTSISTRRLASSSVCFCADKDNPDMAPECYVSSNKP